MKELLSFLQHTWAGVALPLHVALAIWVTVHALLHKREVGSALGWIGLAWFSPFFGGFLYFVLGINRVRRRAHRLAVARHRRIRSGSTAKERIEGSLRPLERALGRITERPTEPGNAIEIYQNGDEAYPVMLQAIAEAKVCIGLSSYIFRGDKVGERFIEALAAAKGRGVEVCVIIDGVGGGWLHSPAYARLRRAGIPVGRFMHSPLPWRMPLLNLRSHKKILVVDGKVGFTGGMNIANENMLAAHPKEPVQDTHFRIQGPAVAQLTDAFAADWSFVMRKELDETVWCPTTEMPGAATARVITSGPDRDVEKIEFAVLQAISCARSTIVVMTPYFLPDDHVLVALGLAAMRGVSVDVVVPLRSNHRLVDWATRATIGPMLRDGVRFWLGPPPFRHSKVMIVDDEWCLIGSSNWDMRSFRLNFELCMEVYHKELAAKLKAFVAENQQARLTPADLAARRMPVRLRDAAIRLLMPYL